MIGVISESASMQIINLFFADSVDEETVLDEADTFVLHLTKVPSYQLRIECTLFKREADSSLQEISTSLTTLDNVIRGKFAYIPTH